MCMRACVHARARARAVCVCVCVCVCINSIYLGSAQLDKAKGHVQEIQLDECGSCLKNSPKVRSVAVSGDNTAIVGSLNKKLSQILFVYFLLKILLHCQKKLRVCFWHCSQ